jgi:hypothetical protein
MFPSHNGALPRPVASTGVRYPLTPRTRQADGPIFVTLGRGDMGRLPPVSIHHKGLEDAGLI